MKIPPLAPLRRQTQPFDDPDWIYEIKHDGFRAKLDAERKRSRPDPALAGAGISRA
jgi:ATP-dependent DNA ligase